MALDGSPDLFAHRFYVWVLFFCFSYSYVRQTKLASSLVNFWAHNKIVFDWLIDWLIQSLQRSSDTLSAFYGEGEGEKKAKGRKGKEREGRGDDVNGGKWVLCICKKIRIICLLCKRYPRSRLWGGRINIVTDWLIKPFDWQEEFRLNAATPS